MKSLAGQMQSIPRSEAMMAYPDERSESQEGHIQPILRSGARLELSARIFAKILRRFAPQNDKKSPFNHKTPYSRLLIGLWKGVFLIKSVLPYTQV